MNVQQAPAATAPNLLQTLVSVAWSFFGVQDARTRHRDFSHGNAWHFIVMGVVMTALTVLGFYGLVQFTLHAYGATG